MPAKIIFDSKSEIPTHLQADAKEVDGKFELDAEGVLKKNKELLGKNSTLSETNEGLEAKITELKSKVLSKGQIAIDPKELDALKNEVDAYKELGSLDEIKPKVEGFEALKTESEKVKKEALLTKAFDAAGITNKQAALNLKQADSLNIQAETVDGKEVFFNVTTDDKGKPVKTAFTADYLKEAEGFKDILPVLTGTQSEGKKMFKQSASGGQTSTIEAEIKAQESTGIYGL